MAGVWEGRALATFSGVGGGGVAGSSWPGGLGGVWGGGGGGVVA